jgi:hypothetical protein
MGQQDASNAAKGRSREQMAQQEQYNRLRDPFTMGGNRQQYVEQLNAMMRGGPSSVAQDPLVKWLQDQGTQQVQRQHSATGDVQSTAETRDLASMGFGQANQYWKQQVDRLSMLSGANQANVTTPTGMSPGDMYEMGMGDTASTAGLWQAGMSVAGMYGKGSGGGGGGSTVPGLENNGWGSDFNKYRG